MEWQAWFEAFLQLLQDWGYWGMLLAGFLSGTIMPLSSEAVLVVLLSQGLDPLNLFLIATSSNWIGGMTTFWIGKQGNLEWIEKYFRVKHEQLLRWERNVEKYGAYFAILGWLPVFGNAIVLALGFFHARHIPSAWWLLVGKLARYAFIIWVMN
jgi:membrane protein YqaA with SNARE-associated domain